MAVWIDVDTWLRQQDPDPTPTRVQVTVAEPEPLPDRFAELLERLDQAAAAHKRSKADRRGGHHSGRRGALISDRELAREVYELRMLRTVSRLSPDVRAEGVKKYGCSYGRKRMTTRPCNPSSCLPDLVAEHGVRSCGRRR